MFLYFSLKNDLNDQFVIKIVTNKVSADQLID